MIVAVALSLAAPTAGFILAVRAVRAGNRSSRIVAALAAILTVVTLLAFPVIGVGWAAITVGLALVVAAVGWFLLVGRNG